MREVTNTFLEDTEVISLKGYIKLKNLQLHDKIIHWENNNLYFDEIISIEYIKEKINLYTLHLKKYKFNYK